MILDLQNIYKDYQQDKLVVPVLKDVSLQVEENMWQLWGLPAQARRL